MISKNDTIKGYTIEDSLGSGGFGEVFLVHSKQNPERKYALKLMKAQALRESSGREKFINEMITMARLSTHPSIVTIYENLIYEDRDDERLGMVMEYVQGESLDRFIYKHGKLVVAKAVPLFLQILDAMEAAHNQGILHRDIKPANIMILTNEEISYQGYKSTNPVRILDFGLAKAMEGNTTYDSMSGATLAYVPPERLAGGKIGPASDIYSLGTVLYEMLTGTLPFDIKSVQDANRLIPTEKPDSILSHYEHHPKALDAVVQQAMAKKAEDRFTSCAEFASALSVACPIVKEDAETEKRQSPEKAVQSVSELQEKTDISPPGQKKITGVPAWLVGVACISLLAIAAFFVVPQILKPVQETEPAERALPPPVAKVEVVIPSPAVPEIIAAVEKPQKGFLKFTSHPEAVGIYLNDELLGVTPVGKDLKSGSYLIKAIKEGFSQQEMTAEVFSGEEDHLFITLEKLPEEKPEIIPEVETGKNSFRQFMKEMEKECSERDRTLGLCK